MIHEVNGDLLLSQAQVIAHGIAPNDHFDSGLALSLREAYPALYKDFRHYCQTLHPKAGTGWMWQSEDGKQVYNLLTQEAAYDHGARPGRATLPYVNHALQALRKAIETENVQSVALPRVATGVGHQDWEDIYPLIQKHLGDLSIPIYVYVRYEKGVAANEPHITPQTSE